MKPPTSTKTITRLGVLTVLASTDLGWEANAKVKAGIEEIVTGKTHVSREKVQARLVERCIIGGMCVGYAIDGVQVTGITGLN